MSIERDYNDDKPRGERPFRVGTQRMRKTPTVSKKKEGENCYKSR
jgi:hypothetical protein